MAHIVEFANQFVIYTACYTFILSIYGYIAYHLVKLILDILSCAWKAVRNDIMKWRFKSKSEKRY